MSSLGISYITFETWFLIGRECNNYTRLSVQIIMRASYLCFPGLGLQVIYYPEQLYLKVLGNKLSFCACKQTFSQPSHSQLLCYSLCSKLFSRHCHSNGHDSCLKTVMKQYLVNHYLIKM